MSAAYEVLDGGKYREPFERWSRGPHQTLCVAAGRDGKNVRISAVYPGAFSSMSIKLTAEEAAELGAQLIAVAQFLAQPLKEAA